MRITDVLLKERDDAVARSNVARYERAVAQALRDLRHAEEGLERARAALRRVQEYDIGEYPKLKCLHCWLAGRIEAIVEPKPSDTRTDRWECANQHEFAVRFAMWP